MVGCCRRSVLPYSGAGLRVSLTLARFKGRRKMSDNHEISMTDLDSTVSFGGGGGGGAPNGRNQSQSHMRGHQTTAAPEPTDGLSATGVGNIAGAVGFVASRGNTVGMVASTVGRVANNWP
jgi:hypothetical protein